MAIYAEELTMLQQVEKIRKSLRIRRALVFLIGIVAFALLVLSAFVLFTADDPRIAKFLFLGGVSNVYVTIGSVLSLIVLCVFLTKIADFMGAIGDTIDDSSYLLSNFEKIDEKSRRDRLELIVNEFGESSSAMGCS